MAGELSAGSTASARRRRLPAAIVISVIALMCAPGLPGSRAAVTVSAPSRDGVRAVCPPSGSGRVHCLALELTAPPGREPAGTAARLAPPAVVAGAAQTPECHIPLASEGCYGLRPEDLHAAYGLPQAVVSTQTLAIVTAGGDPTIKKDLANYDSEFGLPGCPGETPCPMIVNGQGKKHLPAVEGDAPLETSLDVEVAHAVCPGCALLLVEASSASLAAFEEATDTAAELGAGEISISWGEAEPAQVREGGAAFDHPGVVVTAAAGDTGYLNWASPEAERGRPEYPASSPDVIAVGGTDLELGPAGQWEGERVWDQLEPGDEAGAAAAARSSPLPRGSLNSRTGNRWGVVAYAPPPTSRRSPTRSWEWPSTTRRRTPKGISRGGADSEGPVSVPRWSPRRSRSPEGLTA